MDTAAGCVSCFSDEILCPPQGSRTGLVSLPSLSMTLSTENFVAVCVEYQHRLEERLIKWLQVLFEVSIEQLDYPLKNHDIHMIWNEGREKRKGSSGGRTSLVLPYGYYQGNCNGLSTYPRLHFLAAHALQPCKSTRVLVAP